MAPAAVDYSALVVEGSWGDVTFHYSDPWGAASVGAQQIATEHVMLATWYPLFSIPPTVAFLCAFGVQLLIAKLFRAPSLGAPHVFALAFSGLAFPTVATSLVKMTVVAILFMKIWWALSRVS